MTFRTARASRPSCALAWAGAALVAVAVMIGGLRGSSGPLVDVHLPLHVDLVVVVHGGIAVDAEEVELDVRVESVRPERQTAAVAILARVVRVVNHDAGAGHRRVLDQRALEPFELHDGTEPGGCD